MNYIKEINAFYVRLETEPLSMSAVALWHALMHVNNRARWVKRFSVAASVVCAKAGLSVSTFKRARTELKEKRFIVHVPRGSRAPMYEMVSLVLEEVVQEDKGREVYEEAVVEAVVPAQKRETALSFLTFNFFMDHFRNAPKSVVDELYEWGELLGDVLVYEALVRAVDSGKVVWNYVKGILRNWQKAGLYTVEAVELAEERFRQERMERHGVVGRKEVLPDWFKRGRSDVG